MSALKTASIKPPWCLWCCPQCDGEGCAFNVARMGVNCVHCGFYDDSSEQYLMCVKVDRERHHNERMAEERRKREAVPKLTQSPPEWADGPTERLGVASPSCSPFAVKP